MVMKPDWAVLWMLTTLGEAFSAASAMKLLNLGPVRLLSHEAVVRGEWVEDEDEEYPTAARHVTAPRWRLRNLKDLMAIKLFSLGVSSPLSLLAFWLSRAVQRSGVWLPTSCVSLEDPGIPKIRFWSPSNLQLRSLDALEPNKVQIDYFTL